MRRQLQLALLAALPAGTVVLSGLTLAALNTGGEVRFAPLPMMTMGAGYARVAERLLATPQPSAPAAVDAERLTREALAQFPHDNSAWLRLAYAEYLQAGRVTPEVVTLFQRSYALVGSDIYTGPWRIGFILENSQAFPRDVRTAARNEFEILWQDPRKRRELKDLAVAVRNPAGRLSAALWLRRAQAGAAK
jgi:hypothetical protein